MGKLLLVSTAILVTALSASSAQAQGSIRIFGGYSYLRPSLTQTETFVCTAPPCPVPPQPPDLRVTSNPSLNGWEVSATMKLIPFIGITADFSGHTGGALGQSSANYHTYLFGPELRLGRPISPFAHFLLGGAHVSGSNATLSALPYNTVLGFKDTAFASALGGGIDFSVLPFIALRPIQIDLLTTRFHSSTQNQPRISAGLVLHF